METIEALIHRRSCRNYSDRPVEAEKLARIIEAGQYAPSGMGRQPVTFVAVTDPATVERLSQLNAQVMGSNSDPFYGAKTVVVVLVDRSVPTHLEDGSLAMGNLLNAAYALGVDSCWIHRAHEVFDSPEGLELLASWGLPADGSLRGVGNPNCRQKRNVPFCRQAMLIFELSSLRLSGSFRRRRLACLRPFAHRRWWRPPQRYRAGARRSSGPERPRQLLYLHARARAI